MTVSSEIDSVSYAGNGVTVLFPVDYYFLADAHLEVVLRDPLGFESVQTINSQYTVAGAGNQAGGSVTMVIAPPSGYELDIIRSEIPMTQETDYVPNDPFPAESHERALDKLTMLVQQNKRIIDNAIVDSSAALRSDLEDLSGAGIVGFDDAITYPADTVGAAIDGLAADSDQRDAEIDQLQSQQSNSAPLYFKNKVVEVGFRDATYDTLIATYGYNFLYPQAVAVDAAANELWVLRGQTTGANNWAWIWVYDLTTGVRKTTFTTGQQWRESLVIRYDAGTGIRYMYTIGNASSVIRVNVATLPANLSTATIADTYAVNASSFLAYDGQNWYVQDDAPSQGLTVRNRFTIWRQNFATKCGQLVFPFDGMGTLNANMDNFPKSQGICFHQGSIYSATGGPWDAASVVNTQLGIYQQGIMSFSPQGEKERTSLCRPEGYVTAMSSMLGYTATLCESEGMASDGVNLYSLQITLGQTDRVLPANAGKGVVLVKELSTAANRTSFLAAARGTPAALDMADFQTKVHHSTSQLLNPIDATPLTSFSTIVTMMRELSLSCYRFSGSAQTMVDLSAVTVPTGQRLFEFFNTNGNTFVIRVTGSTPDGSFWYVLNTNGTVQVGPYYGDAEYGSNANGEYIKHANGVLECWYVDNTVQIAATSIVGSTWFQSAANMTWTYPVPFVAEPDVTLKVKVNTTITQLAVIAQRDAGTPTTGAVFRIASIVTATDAGRWRGRAIGRWK